MSKAQAPKYPRVMVSATRHIKLAREARARKMDIREVAEEKMKIADKAVKESAPIVSA